MLCEGVGKHKKMFATEQIRYLETFEVVWAHTNSTYIHAFVFLILFSVFIKLILRLI